MFDVGVHRIQMSSPDDVSGLERLLGNGEVQAADIRAILVKSEGDAGVADFSQTLAARAFGDVLASAEAGRAVAGSDHALVMVSGGSEGGMSPHAVIVSRRAIESTAGTAASGSRLSVGTARTRALTPDEIGTVAQVDVVAEAVTEALREAEVAGFDDVGCAIVMSPHLMPDEIRVQIAGGGDIASLDATRLMELSNGAAALGVGVALGEIDREALLPSDIGVNADLNSTAAITFSGAGLGHCEIVVLGNSPQSASGFGIGRAEMDSLVDIRGIIRAVRHAGLPVDDVLTASESRRVAAMFATAVAPLDGRLYGRRVTFQSESVQRYRMTRAAVNAAAASVINEPAVFVAGGHAYHQGTGLAAAVVQL